MYFKSPLCILLLFAAGLSPLATATALSNAPQSTTHISTIKRYLFQADSVAAATAEFARRNIVLTNKLTQPKPGQSLRLQGTGATGFNSYFLIEHSAGQLHVYAERRRPQQPQAPFPYVSQEVVFDTPDPEVSPVGTLTYPTQGGPFPAVVLIAGSGPHDRDGNISLHRTLLVLADHLTRQGFAVLRYDKRGVGLSGGNAHPLPTTDDYAADALAALQFLKIQPQVNSARVGLVGHSEGGIIASMVAAKAPTEVQFVVLLAAPGLPGLELKSLQDAAARRADGMPEQLILANQQQERELFEIAAGNLPTTAAVQAMLDATTALAPEIKSLLEIPAEGIPAAAFEGLLTPWLRRYLQLTPGIYLQQIRCPVLAVLGGKDLQVPAVPNLQAIQDALDKAGNTQSKVSVLPNLNHLLQEARTGQAYEYLLIEQTIAPQALEQVSGWMQQLALSSQPSKPSTLRQQ